MHMQDHVNIINIKSKQKYAFCSVALKKLTNQQTNYQKE